MVVPSSVSRLALIVLLVQAAAATTVTYGPLAASQDPRNQSPIAPGNTSPQTPGNTSPPEPTDASGVVPVPQVDPAAAIFSKTANAGLLLVTVKADKVADYEDVIRALQDGLSKATDARQQALGQGWRVFKSDTDPKVNAIYIHFVHPVVPQTDYRPSRVLDEILAGASAEMLAKYRDAIVGAPSMLSMNEFADMSVPPPKPTNASPKSPAPAKKPGT
jgi:hypothetical protein